MPELPEVETIRRDLERDIRGKSIKDVEVLNPRVIKTPAPATFRKRLKGVAFKEFLRRGKVLAIRLSSGDYLAVHLRMTGQLVYSKHRDKAARAIFILSNGHFLNFNDQRLFGELHLVKDLKELKFVRNLGPEPLDEEFTVGQFREMLSKRRTKIKPLLMDQTFIGGIGNLYVQEALFLSGILPERPANRITDAETKKLYRSIRQVLRQGIRHRGSSIDNYVSGRGEKGAYHLRLRVYDRKGEECPKCKTRIEKYFLGGRGTCYCPKCQK
ncbi:MAG: bifunctional DNA-formamidopyrimidine glycosylase/DNA-(apurinic or apyrimidinic site) lyase [Candidatus Omnitrophica bacterium]|nr:bifunctional DNA-formamidopyrimidine glycosylase/DNA-(apurinic or apyrimidinic site) lyase [Candidatus Omnitrophota bacterium]